MLPADTGLDVRRLGAGTLSLSIVIPLNTIRNVVQRRRLVVQVGESGGRAGIAGEHRWIFALRQAGRVERRELGRERSASAGDNGRSHAVKRVGYVSLTQIVRFERDVPLIVEDMIVGQSVPLQVVVAPLPAIDRVGNKVDAVFSAVGCVANAGGDARGRTGILQERRTWIERVARDQVREARAFVLGYRVAADTIT